MKTKRLISTKYCSKCGSPLNFYYDFYRYSDSTGEKLFNLKATCPNAEKGILGAIKRDFSTEYPKHTKDTFIWLDTEKELVKGIKFI